MTEKVNKKSPDKPANSAQKINKAEKKEVEYSKSASKSAVKDMIRPEEKPTRCKKNCC